MRLWCKLDVPILTEDPRSISSGFFFPAKAGTEVSLLPTVSDEQLCLSFQPEVVAALRDVDMLLHKMSSLSSFVSLALPTQEGGEFLLDWNAAGEAQQASQHFFVRRRVKNMTLLAYLFLVWHLNLTRKMSFSVRNARRRKGELTFSSRTCWNIVIWCY